MSFVIRRCREIIRQGGIKKFCGKLLLYPVNLFWALYYTFTIHNLTKGYNSRQLFGFVCQKTHGLLRPLQEAEEILRLLEFAEILRPRRILEIGTATGGTLFLFCRSASSSAVIVSVDLPGGEFGGGYPFWKIPLYRAFALGEQRIYLLRKDSHKQDTFNKVRNYIGEEGIDFLYIDGDHSYEGVKKDFLMYAPLVRKGGMIVVHDIVVHTPDTGCNVHDFWEEIKPGYRNLEIIKDVRQEAKGIGVLFVE